MSVLETEPRVTFAERARRRQWPILVTGLVLATGMAYSLGWAPIVRHKNSWVVPEDLFGTFRSAHYIAWGAMGSVYGAGTHMVTFPGILVLLAPLAMLTGGLGLTESFPFFVAHPSAWLVLGPCAILIGCTAVFACDALAERLGVPGGRRAALCIAEGVVIWPMLVRWGHPEDALAIALAVYALVLALDGRWTGAGWLFGAAVATQPLIVLILPVLLAMSGKQRAPALLVRCALPAALLLAMPLAVEFHTTAHVLLTQPNYPGINHATPWTALAPRLAGSGKNVAVAAGPGRVAAVLAACMLGWWARRWRDRPDLLVWAVATALALRCFTESVMDPYYVWPTLAVGLVVAARTARGRQVLGLLTAVGVTVSAENHFGEWLWWSMVTAGLVVMLVAAFPPRASRVRDKVPINHNTAGTEPSHGLARALVGATQ